MSYGSNGYGTSGYGFGPDTGTGVSSVQSDLALSYLLRASVYADLSLAYSVLSSGPAPVSSDLSLAYVVRGLVSADQALSYFVRASAANDLSLAWSILSANGTLTSDVLKDNTGAILASVVLNHVAFYNDTTGALVLRKTAISTDSNGRFSVNDAALTPGTVYRIDWETVSGQRRMPRKAAA